MAIYPGSKGGQGVFQAIINQIPPHQVYIEPFLGAGGIWRHKRAAEKQIGVDIDPETVWAFHCATGTHIDANGQWRDVRRLRSLAGSTVA